MPKNESPQRALTQEFEAYQVQYLEDFKKYRAHAGYQFSDITPTDSLANFQSVEFENSPEGPLLRFLAMEMGLSAEETAISFDRTNPSFTVPSGTSDLIEAAMKNVLGPLPENYCAANSRASVQALDRYDQERRNGDAAKKAALPKKMEGLIASLKSATKQEYLPLACSLLSEAEALKREDKKTKACDLKPEFINSVATVFQAHSCSICHDFSPFAGDRAPVIDFKQITTDPLYLIERQARSGRNLIDELLIRVKLHTKEDGMMPSGYDPIPEAEIQLLEKYSEALHNCH